MQFLIRSHPQTLHEPLTGGIWCPAVSVKQPPNVPVQTRGHLVDLPDRPLSLVTAGLCTNASFPFDLPFPQAWINAALVFSAAQDPIVPSFAFTAWPATSYVLLPFPRCSLIKTPHVSGIGLLRNGLDKSFVPPAHLFKSSSLSLLAEVPDPNNPLPPPLSHHQHQTQSRRRKPHPAPGPW